MDITSGRGNGHTVVVKGFDFLVNSVWPEVVALIEKKASVIFSPGNPDTFYKVSGIMCSHLILIHFK